MTQIRQTIDVDARQEDVFTVLTDLDRLPDWSTITVATRDAPAQPLSKGDTFRQSLRVVGRQLDNDWTVTDSTVLGTSRTKPKGRRRRGFGWHRASRPPTKDAGARSSTARRTSRSSSSIASAAMLLASTDMVPGRRVNTGC
jgi:hypothetical protein